MSVIQSKDIIRNDKHEGYYGCLPGGSLNSHCGEMTRDETLTLTSLRQFSPCDYEAYRARGEEFRHRLSGAVLKALRLSDVWRTDFESRGEWGHFPCAPAPDAPEMQARNNRHT